MAGKPAPQLMNDAVDRGDFKAPLVVGDRLDTDIEGANNAGLPSLMVLTGVSTVHDAIYAEPVRRPTYIAHDLRCLRKDGDLLKVGPQPGWRVEVDPARSECARTESGPAMTCRWCVRLPTRYGTRSWTGTHARSRQATRRPATPCNAGRCCTTHSR